MKNFLKKLKSKIDYILYYFKFIVRYNNYKNRCKKESKREFIIFNTPVHGNIGDHAIIYAEEKLLNKLNIESLEVPTRYGKYCFKYLKQHISNSAVVLITGGGFIGSQWLNEEELVIKVIKEFKEHNLIILPQTIFFKNDPKGNEELNKSIKVFNEAKNLTIFARERKTYEFAKNAYTNANVQLVPDIVLSLNKFNFNYEREDVLLCFRNDPERAFSNENEELMIKTLNKLKLNYKKTDTVLKKSIRENKREEIVIEKLQEIAKHKIMITDRLHGMIFASLTNTPCIVFGNYNYKVEGVYEWIKDIDKKIIYEKDINNLENDIKLLLQNDIKQNYEKNYNEKFEVLYKIMEENKWIK